MKNEANCEEKAVNRLILVLQLLDESPEKEPRSQKKKEISKETRVSERTLELYITDYQENGFEGLNPNSSTEKKNRLYRNFD